MAKALDQEMYNYFMQLNEAEKKSVVQMLKTFLRGRGEKPQRTTIEEYNSQVEEAEAEYESGEYISHEQLLKEIKKW